MNKKSLDGKAASSYIIENRNNGMTDQDIYTNLSQEYFDKKAVAILIKGTLTDEIKQKYKLYNNILLGLLGLSIFLKLIMVLNLAVETGELWTLILMLFVPIINIFLIFGVARYQIPIYRLCGFFSILSLMQTISHSANFWDTVFVLIFASLIAGIAFYLYSKLSPNYGPDSIEKDDTGEYQFK